MSYTLAEIQENIEEQLSNSEWFTYKDAESLDMVKDLSHCVTGLNEEAGEVAGLLKKQYYRGKNKPKEQWISELGDVLWYLIGTASIMGISIDKIWEYNCQKLEDRRKKGMKGKDTWEG